MNKRHDIGILKSNLVAVTCVLVTCLFSQSCMQTPEDYAASWTKEIKQKIIEDASQKPDSIRYDSSRHTLLYLKNGKKLKYFYFTPRILNEESRKVVSYDTAFVVFYSNDQNFQLVRQPCIQNAERSYEGVAYKGNRYGAAIFRYCNRDIIEHGFHVNNLNVGNWTKVDSSGTKISSVDNGNSNRLEELKKIEYYR